MLAKHWMENGSAENSLNRAEVTVIGGGIAGMAACIHLSRAGLRVLCIESDMAPSQAVGESLDWSAPDLLARLGLPMEQLIEQGIATYKRHVTLKLGDGSSRHYIPSDWLGRAPFNIELRTMHVDRGRLDAAIRNIVLSLGVQIIQDRVTAVERDGSRIKAVNTARGARADSAWFIDASGTGTSLFAGGLKLQPIEYGPRKVAIWTYFTVPELVEGTTLYAEGEKPAYMEWVWEIPVRADMISVGYVLTGDAVKAKRQQGLTVEDILNERLSRIPRFETLLQGERPISANVRSFRCQVHTGLTGPNWLTAGEAAVMVDPMTANGVTAALRHAAEASRLILRSRHRRRLPRVARAMYGRRAMDIGMFFNCGIEKLIYDGPIRNRIGPLVSGDVYTALAWSLNVVYSRLRPKGIFLTLLYGFVLSLFRAGASIYHAYCKRLEFSRQTAH